MAFSGSGLIGDHRMCLKATMVVKPGIWKFHRDTHIEIKKEISIAIDCTYFIISIWQAWIVVDICLAAKRWGEYSPLLIVLVYGSQKTENIFPSKKVLEIKLLKRNCVTLAAQKWVVLANHFDQRTRKVLFTYIRDSRKIHTAPSLPPSFEDALLSLSLLDSIMFLFF